ncbi:MAG: hypothetical protein JKX99_00080, partial [Robiginitomaculum sp.]|nr:hypothetical protein [Robiginitomaculum sp.]
STKAQTLAAAAMKLGEAMYAQSKAETESMDGTEASDEGVVDAEFEEVDENDDESTDESNSDKQDA